MHSKKIEKDFDDLEKELHIKLGSAKDLIGSLSGGNQQKVVLAKWLDANPKVLVFDNPTQGVDVGAKEEIYDIILKLAEAASPSLCFPARPRRLSACATAPS